MTKSPMIDRRRLLKALTIGAAAPAISPILSSLVCRAAADAAGVKPMRFVFLVEGNGLVPTHIQPVGIERKVAKHPTLGGYRVCNAMETMVDAPLSAPGVSLPVPIAPLERHAKRLTILQGLSGRVCGGGHGNGFGTLGCYPASAGPKDITIDSALARANPAIYQHVALGLLNDPAPKVPSIFTACSASGPNMKVPHFQDPALAYNVLFGTILGGNAEAEVGAQGMLLDHLARDTARLAGRLPQDESHRLQQYAEAFASIGKRQARLREIDAKSIPPRRDEIYGSMVETERMTAHFELAATALVIGLTNTVTLASGATTYPTWKSLGAETDGHALAHASGDLGSDSGVPDPRTPPDQLKARAIRVKIRQFHAEQVAKLVDTLESVPEGGGTMMDNTLIVYLSDSAEDHHSFCAEWPMILVGNLGGRLKLGDRFVNAPTYQAQGHATVAQFYTALLHAAGAPVDHFGMKDKVLEGSGLKQDGPWTEVLA